MIRHFGRAARATLVAALVTGFSSTAFAQKPTAAPVPDDLYRRTAAPAPNDYADAKNWLCLPGHAADACTTDENATIVAADGTLTLEPFKTDPHAKIDCFYVYPTVSRQPTGNADMTTGPEELFIVREQFARFASVCRPYAPLYRQITLAALNAAMVGKPMPVSRELAYGDVLDAWNYYLAHDNHGRGVVLIGHSQGSGVLLQLIKNEIDGKPVQHKLVSAILMGTRLAVPAGGIIGGDFKSIPLCQSAGQTQCVITYASFRADAPPPANTRFGKVQGADMVAACTNPASLAGGSGELHSYMSTSGSFGPIPLTRGPWVKGKTIDTPFVSVPGLLSAECTANAQGTYLAITTHPDPSGLRINEIGGDVIVNGQVQKDWGLHLIDANLAMGNLIDIVRAQTKTYLTDR